MMAAHRTPVLKDTPRDFFEVRGIALAAEVTKGHLHGLSSSLGFQRALPLGAGSFNDEFSPYKYLSKPAADRRIME